VILLGVLEDTGYPYRYFVADTEMDRSTHPYESIKVALTQYNNLILASTRYSIQQLGDVTTYDITGIELFPVDTAKEAILNKYPEILL